MFVCPRMRVRLTEAGCARLFRSTLERRPEPHEGRHHCLACSIGARNAGVSVSPIAGVLEMLRPLCARCTRPSQRLIGGCLCVSCYNRTREVRIGRDRKGRVPLLQLGPRALVMTGGAVAQSVVADSVLDLREAVLTLAKRAEGPLAFAPRILQPPQASLDLGFQSARLPPRALRVRLPKLPPMPSAAPLDLIVLPKIDRPTAWLCA